MSFQTALSGLNASSKNLDVIGNNVANSSTVGFKASTAEFADVFAASLSGAGASQAGIGTKLATVAQQFTQGNITTTNNPLDIAINGKGFFQLSNQGALTYTRNGQFQVDKDGYVVTSSGLRLQGKTASGTPGDMQISTANQPPTVTGNAVVAVNLDSNSTEPPKPWVDPQPAVVGPPAVPAVSLEPDSYNASTSMTVYDNLGNSHVVGLYFVKKAANSWAVNMTVDGYAQVNNKKVVTNPVVDALTFTKGVLDPTQYSPTTVSIDLDVLNSTLGADSPLKIKFDFGKTTQFGSKFSVNDLTQDGFALGRLAGLGIGSDGVLQGRYTNGQTKDMGVIELANFTNPQGLQALGDNQWAESPSSGPALVGAPGTASLGLLQSSATEDSNVDLTAELVNMIVAQRAYQANAQTIKTQDAIQQTLMNLR